MIAALLNGVTLVAVAVLVVIAAVDRLGDPPEVEGAGVLILGVAALAGNAAATWVLAGGQREDINLEAVLRHSAADALGSLGVIVSGAVILTTGWRPIDPLVSIAIAVLILASSVRLVREPLDVLMEAAPPGVDVEAVGRAVCAVEACEPCTSSMSGPSRRASRRSRPTSSSLVARTAIAPGARSSSCSRDRYGIEHTTLQMEEEADDDALLQVETEPARLAAEAP